MMAEKLSHSHNRGIIQIVSNHTVEETVRRLREILDSKGVKLFALVDHSGEAASADMSMPPTMLLIFGSPKVGTQLMLAAPNIAIDLPLKALVSEGANGTVRISYNSPTYLQERHGIPENLTRNISVVESFAAAAAD